MLGRDTLRHCSLKPKPCHPPAKLLQPFKNQSCHRSNPALYIHIKRQCTNWGCGNKLKLWGEQEMSNFIMEIPWQCPFFFFLFFFCLEVVYYFLLWIRNQERERSFLGATGDVKKKIISAFLKTRRTEGKPLHMGNTPPTRSPFASSGSGALDSKLPQWWAERSWQ